METDHRPLEALMQKTRLNSKCERWRLLLQTYDFTVKHIPGASNYMPDYLSRSPVDPPSDDLDDAPDLSIVTTLPAAVSPPSVNVVTTRSRARQTSTLPANSSPSHSTSDLLSLPTPPVSPPATADASDELRIDFTGDLATWRVVQASEQSLRFTLDHIHEPRFVTNYKVLDGILSISPHGEGHRRDGLQRLHRSQSDPRFLQLIYPWSYGSNDFLWRS